MRKGKIWEGEVDLGVSVGSVGWARFMVKEVSTLKRSDLTDVFSRDVLNAG